MNDFVSALNRILLVIASVATILFCTCGCAHYETYIEGYGGSNSAEGGTFGTRAAVIMIERGDLGVGMGGDVAVVLRRDDEEDIDQVVITPFLLVNYRLDVLEPYIAAGPSYITTDTDVGDGTDLGADIRAGAQYFIGTFWEQPAWVFFEVRTIYVDPELEREVSRCNRKCGLTPQVRRVSMEVDEWTTHVVLGLSLRF
jgi:hypothetical protein